MKPALATIVALLISAALWAADRNAQVDRIFSEYDKPGSPGCALGVLQHGAFLYKRGYGMANLDYGLPITSQTLFDIGSTSKQFAAMAVLLLEQQGKLSLDDPVQKFIPEIPDYSERITIRHLLTHTSGLRDYLTLASISGLGDDDFYTDDDVIRMVSRQRELNFKPGDEFLYSNTGFFLLSQIVKRVTGQSLRQFAEAGMLRPLGMNASHFHDDHTEIDRNRATGYSPRDEGKPGAGFRINMSTLDMIGDGGIYTSVEELAKWDENFYTAKVGGRELLQKMQTPGTLNSGEKLEYGLGLFAGSYRGLKTISHGGSWAGFRAELLRFPEQHFSVICLCNVSSANPTRLARRVADVFLGSRMQPEPQRAQATSQIPAAQLEDKAGWYRNPTTSRVMKLEVRQGRLTALPFGLDVPLEPLGATEFRSTDAPVQVRVKFEAGASPLRMQVLREGQKPEVFEKVSLVQPTAEALQDYVGDYYSPEIDSHYRFELQDGKLHLRLRNGPKDPLMPTVKDEFQVEGLTFAFVRSGGRVRGFHLGAGRVKNICFERVEGAAPPR